MPVPGAADAAHARHPRIPQVADADPQPHGWYGLERAEHVPRRKKTVNREADMATVTFHLRSHVGFHD